MISLDKKYRYRDGRPARVLCVDRPSPDGGGRPVVSMNEEGGISVHLADGRATSHGADSDLDLIEVREPLECWVWVSEIGDKVGGVPCFKKPVNPAYRLFREVTHNQP